MNENGAVSILFILFLPVLLSVAAVIGAGYIVLLADGRARHICRTEFLRAQSDVARNLNALFALNPEARILRFRRQIAEAEVAATVGTPAHLAAHAKLQAVIRAQLALSLRQKKLLTQARRISSTAPAIAIMRIQEEIQKRQALFAPRIQTDEWRARRRKVLLNLRIAPTSSLTPDYEAGPGFSETQEMHLSWSFSAWSIVPTWLRPILGSAPMNTKAECAATLIKENGKWNSILTREAKL